MSNRLFQGVIHQMKDAIDQTIGVIDDSSIIIACSELGRIGEVNENISAETMSSAGTFTINGYTYKSFGSGHKPEYAVFVSGSDKEAVRYANMLAVSLSSIKQYYDEKYDRSNFIKNVILDNILPGDIYIKARELHFSNEATHVCFLIRIKKKSDVIVYDIIQDIFPDRNKDFVININDNDIALIKEVPENIEEKDLDMLAESIVDTLENEYYVRCVIGIGTKITGIRELARSFKESQVAMEVGKVFDTDRSVINYDNLGIARLIYQLPTTLCDMFLNEVFQSGTIDSLDQETLFTIQKFFENNLNVSETSRKLFVHRNTLVYRLEKIKKITGLDLREFEDAIVFKVALMVKKYLSAKPARF